MIVTRGLGPNKNLVTLGLGPILTVAAPFIQKITDTYVFVMKSAATFIFVQKDSETLDC